METKLSTKPIICDFPSLLFALRAIHQQREVHVKMLHDLWMMGAPTPQSRMLLKRYDERVIQAGVKITRIVFPSKLRQWMILVAGENGIGLDEFASDKLISAIRNAWG